MKTTSAFQLSPLLQIIRPIQDVHRDCEEDVNLYCKDVEESFVHIIKADSMEEYYYDNTDAEFMRRKLSTSETEDEETVIRTVSLSLNVEVGNDKKQMESLEDSKRRYVLDYGTKTDTCLWNAHEDKKISNKCAQALENLDLAHKYTNFEQIDSDGTITQFSITVSISLAGFFAIIVYFWLVSEICRDNEEDEENQDESNENDYVKLEDDESSSSQKVHVAVPVKVV